MLSRSAAKLFAADDGDFAPSPAFNAEHWDVDFEEYISHTRINISIRDID